MFWLSTMHVSASLPLDPTFWGDFFRAELKNYLKRVPHTHTLDARSSADWLHFKRSENQGRKRPSLIWDNFEWMHFAHKLRNQLIHWRRENLFVRSLALAASCSAYCLWLTLFSHQPNVKPREPCLPRWISRSPRNGIILFRRKKSDTNFSLSPSRPLVMTKNWNKRAEKFFWSRSVLWLGNEFYAWLVISFHAPRPDVTFLSYVSVRAVSVIIWFFFIRCTTLAPPRSLAPAIVINCFSSIFLYHILTFDSNLNEPSVRLSTIRVKRLVSRALSSSDLPLVSSWHENSDQ